MGCLLRSLPLTLVLQPPPRYSSLSSVTQLHKQSPATTTTSGTNDELFAPLGRAHLQFRQIDKARAHFAIVLD